MAIIQLRIDDDLKIQAVSVFEKLGIDLSSAIRMFLKRSVLVNGIPFSMVFTPLMKSDENAAVHIPDGRCTAGGVCPRAWPQRVQTRNDW